MDNGIEGDLDGESVVSLALTSCAVILGYLASADLFEWKKRKKEKDSLDLVIIRNPRRFWARTGWVGWTLIIIALSFIDFVRLSVASYLYKSHQYFSFFIIAISLFSLWPWKYRFDRNGIKPVPGYPGGVLPWDCITDLKWQEGKDDVLIVTHQRGYTKIKVFEKRSLVEEIIKKYKGFC